jgi:copper ion binding protein
MKSIKIKGMSCQHCVMAVTRALGAIEGIRDVHVDLEKGTATYQEDKPVSADAVIAAIRNAGYDVVD